MSQIEPYIGKLEHDTSFTTCLPLNTRRQTDDSVARIQLPEEC